IDVGQITVREIPIGINPDVIAAVPIGAAVVECVELDGNAIPGRAKVAEPATPGTQARRTCPYDKNETVSRIDSAGTRQTELELGTESGVASKRNRRCAVRGTTLVESRGRQPKDSPIACHGRTCIADKRQPSGTRKV